MGRAFSSLAKEEGFVNKLYFVSFQNKQKPQILDKTRVKTKDQRFYEKRKKMFRRKKESWLLSILILPFVHAYGPIYTEGTSITHRSIRSVGPQRQRIKEELLNALGIPALWNSRDSSRSTRNTGPGVAADPTKNSFSIFMLDIYNKITEPEMGKPTEIAVLSKPALKIRKSRKTGAIPSSKTFLSNMELTTDELRD